MQRFGSHAVRDRIVSAPTDVAARADPPIAIRKLNQRALAAFAAGTEPGFVHRAVCRT